MSQVKVNFEPFVDDETNPDERILAFHNGLSAQDPFCDYRGGLIRIKQLPEDRLEVELYGLSNGVTVRVPRKVLAPQLPVDAYWVASVEGAWLVLHDCVAGHVQSGWSKPLLADLVASIAEAFNRTLVWRADVDDQAERLERLAARLGLPEQKVLEQLLKVGRLTR